MLDRIHTPPYPPTSRISRPDLSKSGIGTTGSNRRAIIMPTTPVGADLLPEDAFTALADRADAADRDPAWPTASWEVIAQAGVLGWAIPTTYGGSELDAAALLH